MVQREVLEQVKEIDLSVFVVWEPILALDSEAVARRATIWIPDPRAHHYWTDRRDLGTALAPILGLSTEPAWDVYLLYPPKATWEDTPPTPRSFMHQLMGRLPEERHLEGGRLAAEIRELARSTQGRD